MRGEWTSCTVSEHRLASVDSQSSRLDVWLVCPTRKVGVALHHLTDCPEQAVTRHCACASRPAHVRAVLAAKHSPKPQHLHLFTRYCITLNPKT